MAREQHRSIDAGAAFTLGNGIQTAGIPDIIGRPRFSGEQLLAGSLCNAFVKKFSHWQRVPQEGLRFGHIFEAAS
jgi:hypothetical protein